LEQLPLAAAKLLFTVRKMLTKGIVTYLTEPQSSQRQGRLRSMVTRSYNVEAYIVVRCE